MALYLERQQQLRVLICFVERWSSVRQPTAKAQLAQARAFLDLRLMDRAWVRLQELQYDERERIEVLRLTAQMFLLRGWPNRALKPIADALSERPSDPELLRLRNEAENDAPPTDPGISLEDENDIAIALPLAEHYLATGAFLKAQRLLEKLKRNETSNQRIEDLLWALEGDFTSSEESLLDFCEKYRPPPSTGSEEVSNLGDSQSLNPKIALFPNLFRDVTDPSIEVTEEVEITELQHISPASDLPEFPDTTDDTDVLHVIGDIAYSELDSDTFGLDQVPLPPETEIEEEDDNLIVLTRAADADLGSRQLTDDLDTIELDPSEDIPLFERAFTESTVVRYAQKRGLLKTRKSRWWILVLLLSLAGLGLALVILAVVIVTAAL